MYGIWWNEGNCRAILVKVFSKRAGAPWMLRNFKVQFYTKDVQLHQFFLWLESPCAPSSSNDKEDDWIMKGGTERRTEITYFRGHAKKFVPKDLSKEQCDNTLSTAQSSRVSLGRKRFRFHIWLRMKHFIIKLIISKAANKSHGSRNCLFQPTQKIYVNWQASKQV